MQYLIQQLSLKHLDKIISIVDDAMKNDFPEYKTEKKLVYRKNTFNQIITLPNSYLFLSETNINLVHIQL